MHEDPAIYRRDETKLHLVEAFAHNAARGMVVLAIEHVRERRKVKEVRVPMRLMDEWVVFTTKVVLDSGEFTAQGEIERKVAEWLDHVRDTDWARLDRLKERYMRFTSDWRGESKVEKASEPKSAPPREEGDAKKRATARRPARTRTAYPDADAEFFEDDQ
jgi:hypothetical protein